MAKKSRRARRQQRVTRPPTMPSPTTAGPSGPPFAEPSIEPQTLAAPPVRRQVDFSAEYRYVISDLRSMAIIAIAMLVVLIALSFVIS